MHRRALFSTILVISSLWVAILIGVGWCLVWLWCSLPWWSVMSSIFSCVRWPFWCPLWRNVYLDLLILKSDCSLCCCCYWDDWALCICWILTLYSIYGLQNFLPLCRLSFYSVNSFYCSAEAFEFNVSHLFCFSFVCVLEIMPPHIIAKTNISDQSYVVCPRSHSWQMQSQVLNPYRLSPACNLYVTLNIKVICADWPAGDKH